MCYQHKSPPNATLCWTCAMRQTTSWNCEPMTKRQPLLLEAKDCCRIPVTVPRCTADSWPSAEGPEQLEVACRQHLRDTVQLRWWLPSLEHGGEASLDEVPWTSHMLDTILQSPLQW
ncbi:hypothetical protein MTO96_032505, partial [Rhipicephalus appendiculatus]